MEPVSFVASIATLIGTAKAAEKAGRALLLVKNAKVELQVLDNEVSEASHSISSKADVGELNDLCATLRMVQRTADKLREISSEEDIKYLSSSVVKASSIIQSAKTMIEGKYGKLQGPEQVVRRIGFLRPQRLQRIQQDLKCCRLDLHATLVAALSVGMLAKPLRHLMPILTLS